MVTTLAVRDAVCGYSDKTVVDKISFDVSGGEILCLLGPNGVGKTTLFKTILGFLKLKSGTISVDGEDVRKWPRRRFAQMIGYVPQAHTPPFGFKALHVVSMGRTAHLDAFATPTAQDQRIAIAAMRALQIEHLSDRVYTEISGGERQLVLIARALTQQPRILVMDEPTSNLDFGNQVRVLRQIKKLAAAGLGVVMTTHVPDHAFMCATSVVLMHHEGFEVGQAEDIVTEANLRRVYGVDVKVARTRSTDGQVLTACLPLLN